MKFEEIFSQDKVSKIPAHKTIGIDIGSRQSKAVLLANGELYTALIPTGFFMKKTAQELLDILFEQSGLSIEDIDYIVGTGYGRIALEFENTPNRIVTEISCHGLGAHYLGNDIHTIVDIGGQDSKAIRIDPENGKVLEFVMNDKCAAGTGRFLEKSADILGVDVTEIGELSLQSSVNESINSQCIVFAESEIISARAKGVKSSDIAAGVHASVARRVRNLLNRVGIEPNVLFTGGVSNNVGMRVALEEVLGFPIETSKLNTVFAGALGAALFGGQYAETAVQKKDSQSSEFVLDLSELEHAVERTKEEYIKKTNGKKKNIAYLCNYTPLEVMAAADVSAIRLFHVGTKKEITSGEMYTRSVFCDLTKGIIGGFMEENPLYKAIDKVYSFYTCDCMRKSGEVLNTNFVPTTVFNLPRMTWEEDSRKHYADEIRAFKKDLETLTGTAIDDEKIRENINLYNQAKQKLRKISEYRKRVNPPITGTQYQKIAQSYFYLPIDVLLTQLDIILKQLENAPEDNGANAPVRFLVTGGILAEGDEKLTKIVEKEVGAKIVIEDSCSGYSPFAYDIEEDGKSDVFEELATGYFGKAPCARMFPMDKRLDFTEKLAKEYKVDGIIYYYLKFCPSFGIGKDRFTKRFQGLNIPILELATDYSSSDEGQVRTRVEAFKEVLEERK